METDDFGLISMQGRDYYTGYLYAAIRNRANRMAQLANENLKTKVGDDLDTDEIHPYLELVNQSPQYSNYFFWSAISTFFDLRGRNYILVVRRYPGDEGSNKTYGDIQSMELLSPFNVTKVVSGENGETGGYVETTPDGRYRTIPPQQIIDIPTLNPFNLKDGYPMVDAAKEDQYLNQQAGAYTRSSIKHNVGQRGALTTDVILEKEQFENFKKGVEKEAGVGGAGKFLYGNGPGAINYKDMQIDMNNLAMDKINEVSRQGLFAVTGTSKTLLGIEESGTTRDTAKTHVELFLSNHVIPQLQLAIDAFNQDYKNSYPKDYASKPVDLYIDSPLKVDKESELKDAEIEGKKAETAVKLIDGGFNPDKVLDYLGLEELEFDERQPRPGTMPPASTPDDEKLEPSENKLVINQFAPGLEQVVRGYETTLQNQVSNIEWSIFQSAIDRVGDKFTKNQLSESEGGDLLTKKEREKHERELVVVLAAFYLAIIPLFASQTTNQRLAEFKLPSLFSMNRDITNAVKARSLATAESHMDTVLKDIYRKAREAAKEGLSRDAIVSRLTAEYQDLTRVDATRLARTESYKAINMAQFEADVQFIKQNGLDDRAYKRWVVQSNNPCPFCQKLDGKEVPFHQNFFDMGDSLKAQFKNEKSTTTREMTVNFEPISAGNLHPNCNCTYELVIKGV